MGPLLAEWVEAYLAGLAARRAAARTVETRRAHLARFVAWCLDRSVRHGALVTSAVILDYQRDLFRYRDAQGRPYALTTRRGALSDLRAFGRWCVAEGLVEGDPFAVIALPKAGQRLPVLFSAEQIAALLAVPDTTTPIGLRNRSMLELTAAVGVLGRELAALRLEDVEPETGALTVRPLERGRARQVPVRMAAGRWLRQYLAAGRPRLMEGRPPAAALFVSCTGRALEAGDVAHMARSAARAAGLPTRRVLPTVKDSLAVQLLEGGCDPRFLAALFGHADLQSVRKYQRLSVHRLREVYRRCHPAEQGAGSLGGDDRDTGQ